MPDGPMLTTPPTAPSAARAEALARELWEVHATHNQAVIDFPQAHWDEVDEFNREHWRIIARAALAFLTAPCT